MKLNGGLRWCNPSSGHDQAMSCPHHVGASRFEWCATDLVGTAHHPPFAPESSVHMCLKRQTASFAQDFMPVSPIKCTNGSITITSMYWSVWCRQMAEMPDKNDRCVDLANKALPCRHVPLRAHFFRSENSDLEPMTLWRRCVHRRQGNAVGASGCLSGWGLMGDMKLTDAKTLKAPP